MKNMICKYHWIFFLICTLIAADALDAAAQYIRNNAARRNVRGTSRRTARRVDRRQDYWDAGRYGGYGYGTGAAVVGTAALMSLPANCVARDISGMSYSYCDGHYYQPQYDGADVVYIEVEIEEDDD